MTTWHHLNGQLFWPVRNLRELSVHPKEYTTKDVDTRGNPDPEKFWQRKDDEAYKSGVYKSIKKEGIVNPVVLTRERDPYIRNGYHRVAAMYSFDPTSFVPVTYDVLPEAQADRLPGHDDRWDEEPRWSQRSDEEYD